jgi:ribosomal protein L9
VHDPIKTLGSHQVRVRLHPEVVAPVDIEIAAS